MRTGFSRGWEADGHSDLDGALRKGAAGQKSDIPSVGPAP